MNPWQVLGLSPTGDLDAVKQAYAEKVKLFHPEEHPEEFQTLHEAYRKASRYARQHAAAPSAPNKEPVPARPAVQTLKKPAIYTPASDDNAHRQNRYRSSDDEFSRAQFQDFCTENKRVGRPLPRTSSSVSLPAGKIPIRGAKRQAEPVGGLNFSALHQEEPPQDAADDSSTTAPQEADASSPAAQPEEPSAEPERRFPVNLLLLPFFLVPLIRWLPLPVSVGLFIVYLAYQAYRDEIRRSWVLTIEEIVTECTVLAFFNESLQQADFYDTAHLVLKILAGCLFLYRVIRRRMDFVHTFYPDSSRKK